MSEASPSGSLGDAVSAPNLVIIGSQKSGTTSLYHYLRRHPDIFMSYPVKEPGYFMRWAFIAKLFRELDRPVRGRREVLEKHMLRGYSGERYFGDASTYYTIGKRSELHQTHGRMRRAQPAMRLLYVVRNPLERIVSSFLHGRRAGHFGSDFKEFLGSAGFATSLLTSSYWTQLSVYLREFPRDQFKVVLFEDLVGNAARVVAEILEFLALPALEGVSNRVYNRSKNRQEFKASELLFPVKDYRAAMRVLEAEVGALGAFMGRGLEEWDLSRRRWCTLRRASR